MWGIWILLYLIRPSQTDSFIRPTSKDEEDVEWIKWLTAALTYTILVPLLALAAGYVLKFWLMEP